MNKNNYSPEELDIFKHKLLGMEISVQQQIQILYDQRDEISDNVGDEKSTDDNASYTMQIEAISSAIHRLQKHLNQIENALIRIKNKRYGICAETGELILKNRLLAVPTTTLSIRGKEIRAKKV